MMREHVAPPCIVAPTAIAHKESRRDLPVTGIARRESLKSVDRSNKVRVISSDNTIIRGHTRQITTKMWGGGLFWKNSSEMHKYLRNVSERKRYLTAQRQDTRARSS